MIPDIFSVREVESELLDLCLELEGVEDKVVVEGLKVVVMIVELVVVHGNVLRNLWKLEPS